MTYSLAVAGKGGTGKTTVCGLLIDELVKMGKGPILAVDADANSNLNEVLGIEKPDSLGDIREEVAKSDKMGKSVIPTGMSKQEYTNFRFASAVAEEDNYDLLVMGRTQGKGCYCYVNDLLRDQIEKYHEHYNYMIVDNEAGLEHISRGILPPVDMILLVSDCSRRGIEAAGRIAAMIAELDFKAKKVALIVNKAPSPTLAQGLLDEIALQKLDLLAVLPQDERVYEFDADGKPTVKLPPDSPLRKALSEAIKKLEMA
jgi:CO dehydrogenase maturation factor